MKIKTIVISLTLSAALLGGGVYGAYRYSQSHKTPVKVISVESANIGGWFFDDSDSGSALEGSVFTQDTQSVDRNTKYALTKVYVEEGDQVKVGDPLLEYDMTLEELKREREQITKTSYELQLGKTEKALEKFKANPNATDSFDSDTASVDSADTLDADDDDSDDTASALIEDEEEEADGVQLAEDMGETSADAGSDQSQSETTPETDAPQSETTPETNPPQSEATPETDAPQRETQETDPETDAPQSETTAETDPETDNPLIDPIDPGTIDAPDITETEIPLIDDDDPDGLMNGLMVDLDETDQLVYSLTEFRMLVNRLDTLYQDDPKTLQIDAIDEALKIFREQLSDKPSKEAQTIVHLDEDAFGSERDIKLYRASTGETGVIAVLESMLGEAEKTEKVGTCRQLDSLYRAYLNVLYYRFLYHMEVIETSLQTANTTAKKLTDEQVRMLSPQIKSAVEAWYEFSEEWKSLSPLFQEAFGYENLKDTYGYTQEALDKYYQTHYEEQIKHFLGEDQDINNKKAQILPLLAYRLGKLDLIEDPETEPLTEPFTEPDPFGDDFPDVDPGDPSTMTREEIEEQIRSYESSIKELKLNIRESEIKLHQYDRTLDGRVVKATINGVVKKAGSVGSSTGSEFIVITGSAGIYVKVNVNELKRDTIKIGDIVTGTNYENSQMFSGVVTEISEFPTNNENSYYYWGGGGDNPNASFYPVTAYVEDAEGMTDGSYVSVTITSSDSASAASGIYLENYLVRSDRQGRSYVFVQGKDGTLEKRYVKTGSGLWGSGVQIKSGLTTEDYIAFPYGKDVVEGAATQIADSLYDE